MAGTYRNGVWTVMANGRQASSPDLGLALKAVFAT